MRTEERDDLLRILIETMEAADAGGTWDSHWWDYAPVGERDRVAGSSLALRYRAEAIRRLGYWRAGRWLVRVAGDDSTPRLGYSTQRLAVRHHDFYAETARRISERKRRGAGHV